jgi:bacteriorhodopsin
VSAIGVALGFAAQAGGGFGSTFTVFALVALPLALFLGLATFARTVELQREAYVYITGMNRIRRAIADAVPASRPYLVLSIYDDASGVYRSQGTGIRLRPPRFRLVFMLSQTQGIVAVICASIAGIIGWIATARFDSALAWGVAGVAFVITVTALLVYWNRSIAQLQKAIRPMFPTPAEAVDAPI